jgi:hypothetical protein
VCDVLRVQSKEEPRDGFCHEGDEQQEILKVYSVLQLKSSFLKRYVTCWRRCEYPTQETKARFCWASIFPSRSMKELAQIKADTPLLRET